jgi:hypothetical protein
MTAEYSEKEKEKENDKKDNKKDNKKVSIGTKLLMFFIYVVISFIIVFFTGLLGANFTFLTKLSKESMDKLFPVDEKKPPYMGEKQAGGRKMRGGGSTNSDIDITKNTLMTEPFFSEALFDYGFPYSMEDKEASGFFSILGNWLANKIIYSNIWLNGAIRKTIEFIGKVDGFIPASFQDLMPFIFGPLFIGIIISMAALWWLPTLVSTFMEETGGRNATIISVVGLFLGWTWLIPVLISVAQIFSVLFKFIVFPGLVSGKETEKGGGAEKYSNYLLEIMGNTYNLRYLSLLIGILVSVSAFINFDTYEAIAALLAVFSILIPMLRSGIKISPPVDTPSK